MKTATQTLLILLFLATSLSADIIHYKDGRKLEGVILQRTADAVKIDTNFGTITVEMAKIARIEKSLTPAQQLAQRRAQVADENAEAIFQLALWADEHSLRQEFKALLLEVIAADPTHKKANERLGRVEVDGAWLEPSEVDRYLAKVADEKRAQGLEFYEGEWLPRAEVMTARGFLEYGGEWLPRREVETRRVVEDLVSMADYTCSATAGEHVTIFSTDLGSETIESLIYDLDAMTRDFLERLQLNQIEIDQITKYDIPIFLLPDTETSNRIVQSGFTRRFVHSEEAIQDFLDSNSYGLQWPRPLLVNVEGDYLDASGDRGQLRTGILSHQLAELLIERLKGVRNPPAWAKAGLAAFYEGATNYYSTTTLTSSNPLKDGVPAGLWVPGWENFPEWRDNLRDEGMQSTIRSLSPLWTQSAESLNSRDVGICWSFVSFLLDRHPTEFSEFLRVYDSDTGANRALRRMHERAWIRAFASDEAQIERSWRSWALARPKSFPTDILSR